MATAVPVRITTRTLKLVPALCLFLASLAILVFALYPMYVIRPFREQRPAALERALWVLLHDKDRLESAGSSASINLHSGIDFDALL